MHAVSLQHRENTLCHRTIGETKETGEQVRKYLLLRPRRKVEEARVWVA
jgi:hypothetical protein